MTVTDHYGYDIGSSPSIKARLRQRRLKIVPQIPDPPPNFVSDSHHGDDEDSISFLSSSVCSEPQQMPLSARGDSHDFLPLMVPDYFTPRISGRSDNSSSQQDKNKKTIIKNLISSDEIIDEIDSSNYIPTLSQQNSNCTYTDNLSREYTYTTNSSCSNQGLQLHDVKENINKVTDFITYGLQNNDMYNIDKGLFTNCRELDSTARKKLVNLFVISLQQEIDFLNSCLRNQNTTSYTNKEDIMKLGSLESNYLQAARSNKKNTIRKHDNDEVNKNIRQYLQSKTGFSISILLDYVFGKFDSTAMSDDILQVREICQRLLSTSCCLQYSLQSILEEKNRKPLKCVCDILPEINSNAEITKELSDNSAQTNFLPAPIRISSTPTKSKRSTKQQENDNSKVVKELKHQLASAKSDLALLASERTTFLDWRTEAERRHSHLMDELSASQKNLFKVVAERDQFVEWWQKLGNSPN